MDCAWARSDALRSKLSGFMHLWIQNCYTRASDVPKNEQFDEEMMYEALSLAQICKSDIKFWLLVPIEGS